MEPTPLTPAPVVVEDYAPAVLTSFGTVTDATLGTNKKEGADDTEYWH
jgi:hypothetical protein